MNKRKNTYLSVILLIFLSFAMSAKANDPISGTYKKTGHCDKYGNWTNSYQPSDLRVVYIDSPLGGLMTMEYPYIGGIQMTMGNPLIPINASYTYFGIENGWYKFGYGGFIFLYFNGNKCRIEKRARGEYAGFDEYTKQ